MFFCLLARINSSSVFGRRVLFLAAKTGTPFHFFLPKVEWGAIFGPFRFWHDRSMMGKSPDPFLPRFLGTGSGYARPDPIRVYTPSLTGHGRIRGRFLLPPQTCQVWSVTHLLFYSKRIAELDRPWCEERESLNS